MSPGASVLDIGCGDGVMLQFLMETRNVRAVGIDVSAEAVSRACARGVDARVQMLGDLAATGETFDHVVMSEVVEHVADAERFVLDAWALTRKTLWLTFPNIAYFPHRLRLLSGTRAGAVGRVSRRAPPLLERPGFPRVGHEPVAAGPDDDREQRFHGGATAPHLAQSVRQPDRRPVRSMTKQRISLFVNDLASKCVEWILNPQSSPSRSTASTFMR